MKYALAIAMTGALALSVDAAAAASKKHQRYHRHMRAPAAVAPAPSWDYGPNRIIRPRANVPPGTCIQDEGYGRWTYCGQGRS
jgi:hypothetical protein